MRKGAHCHSLILGAALLVACASSPRALQSDAGDRDAFLRRVDDALKARRADALLAVSDVNSWLAAGRPQPVDKNLVLPPAPITRMPDDEPADGNSGLQTLYQDGSGRRWRMRLQHSSDAGWRVVLHSELCPSGGGMARGLDFNRPPAKQTRPATWTPLECVQLPK